MTLDPVPVRTYGDQIFSQLAAEILTGRYQPGDNLPSERTLAEVLHVNRQVVREALKRLAQVGLTSIQQGGGNRVLDFRKSAGLDLMALMAGHANITAYIGDYWESIFEMRAAVAADLARLCALRATPAQKDELVALSHAIRNAASDTERVALDRRFWTVLHDGAQNIAYRLAYNTMLRSLDALGEATTRWLTMELQMHDYYKVVAEAIHAGDAERAESQLRADMRRNLELYVARRNARRERKGDVGPFPPADREVSQIVKILQNLELPLSRRRRSEAQ
jgi:DNA-binding FadR family transcriptional regulator